jgi:hypothetical protein
VRSWIALLRRAPVFCRPNTRSLCSRGWEGDEGPRLDQGRPGGVLVRDDERADAAGQGPPRLRRYNVDPHLTQLIAEPGAWFAADRLATVLAAQPALRPIWILNSTRWLVGAGPLRSR